MEGGAVSRRQSPEIKQYDNGIFQRSLTRPDLWRESGTVQESDGNDPVFPNDFRQASVLDEKKVGQNDEACGDREDRQYNGDENDGPCQDRIFVDEFSQHRVCFLL